MYRVSSVLRVLSVACPVFLAGLFFSAPASAVRLTNISGGPVVVRLCPVKCVEVTGHGFAIGRPVAVYETIGGWSRVSGFIDPDSLKATFGEKVPPKPAFWIPVNLLGQGKSPVKLIQNNSEQVDSASSENEIAEEKKKNKKVKKVAQQRRVTIPKFRPGTEIKLAALVDNEKPAAASSGEENKAKPADKAATKMATGDDVTEAKKVEPMVMQKAGETSAAKPVYKTPQPLNTEPKTDETAAARSVQKTSDVATDTSSEEVKVAKVETKFASEDPDPLVTEVRPDKYIKALDDKRLKKLPGRKSKLYKREEVVALRHHALMLLKNNECNGITRGGRSLAQKGMLYVVCTDDPTFLRQFPLKAQSW